MNALVKYLLAFVLIFCGFQIASAEAPPTDTLRLTLRECLDRAMQGNLDIREAQLERDRALIDQLEANRAFWLPVFEARSYLSVVKDARGYVTDHPLTTSWDNFGPCFEFHLQAAQPISTLGRV
ncbi:MAG TPA: TolC family protein, partial [Candidatus Latescibacteria bacterium]|nr:TolC family protein [Candidatus Latescibacterota bacterium]